MRRGTTSTHCAARHIMAISAIFDFGRAYTHRTGRFGGVSACWPGTIATHGGLQSAYPTRQRKMRRTIRRHGLTHKRTVAMSRSSLSNGSRRSVRMTSAYGTINMWRAPWFSSRVREEWEEPRREGDQCVQRRTMENAINNQRRDAGHNRGGG